MLGEKKSYEGEGVEVVVVDYVLWHTVEANKNTYKK